MASSIVCLDTFCTDRTDVAAARKEAEKQIQVLNEKSAGQQAEERKVSERMRFQREQMRRAQVEAVHEQTKALSEIEAIREGHDVQMLLLKRSHAETMQQQAKAFSAEMAAVQQGHVATVAMLDDLKRSSQTHCSHAFAWECNLIKLSWASLLTGQKWLLLRRGHTRRQQSRCAKM